MVQVETDGFVSADQFDPTDKFEDVNVPDEVAGWVQSKNSPKGILKYRSQSQYAVSISINGEVILNGPTDSVTETLTETNVICEAGNVEEAVNIAVEWLQDNPIPDQLLDDSDVPGLSPVQGEWLWFNYSVNTVPGFAMLLQSDDTLDLTQFVEDSTFGDAKRILSEYQG